MKFQASFDLAKIARHPHGRSAAPGQEGQASGSRVRPLNADAFTVEPRTDKLAHPDAANRAPRDREKDQAFEEELHRCRRFETPVAVLILDIDRFAAVNDLLGRAAGDAVLTAFGNRLRACIRSTDVVARLAGDEFGMVLVGLHGTEKPAAVARRILAVLARPWPLGGREFRLSASIGIACSTRRGSVPALLAVADKAMQQAKVQGPCSFCLEWP